MAFYSNVIKDLTFDKRPALVTHTNDISIHFQSFKEDGVIFATSNRANDDYVKAYIEGGQVYVEYFIQRAGGEVSRSDQLYSQRLEKNCLQSMLDRPY